jgi:hypothetical protein
MKSYKTITENIAWADFIDYRDKHSSERYCLANRNCEHFANSIIYGINFSKQMRSRRKKRLN